MHNNAQEIFTRHCLDYFKPSDFVLECGPGLNTPHWYEHQLIARDGDKHRRWETADVNAKRTDVTYHVNYHDYGLGRDSIDESIQTSKYDVVFSSMVVEHTPKPWLWFAELARVCKPGGLVICIAPFVGPKHGDDYWRVLPQGLKALAEWAELETLEAELYEIAPGDWRGPDTVHVDSLLIARKL